MSTTGSFTTWSKGAAFWKSMLNQPQPATFKKTLLLFLLEEKFPFQTSTIWPKRFSVFKSPVGRQTGLTYRVMLAGSDNLMIAKSCFNCNPLYSVGTIIVVGWIIWGGSAHVLSSQSISVSRLCSPSLTAVLDEVKYKSWDEMNGLISHTKPRHLRDPSHSGRQSKHRVDVFWNDEILG